MDSDENDKIGQLPPSNNLLKSSLLRNSNALPPKPNRPGSNLPPSGPSAPKRNRSDQMTTNLKNQSINTHENDWKQYFTEKVQLTDPETNFNFNIYRKGDHNLPAFLLLHGGGFTGLTFANFVEEISSLLKVQCIAPDLRGHGLSQSFEELSENDPRRADFYSLDNFSKDLSFIIKNLPGFTENDTKIPSIILVGHSMGGAIAAHLSNDQNFPYSLACIAMLDVIEGSAMAALPAMKGVIEARPTMFSSYEDAVHWALSTRYIKSAKSAAISVPSQIKKINENSSKFIWRTNLLHTSPFWDQWFKGMDKKFLNANCGPKVILVADPNNLDKEMTIAQMQGKFTIQMLPQSGHAVHEDCAKGIANKFAAYIKRFRIAESIQGGYGTNLPANFHRNPAAANTAPPGSSKIRAYGADVLKEGIEEED